MTPESALLVFSLMTFAVGGGLGLAAGAALGRRANLRPGRPITPQPTAPPTTYQRVYPQVRPPMPPVPTAQPTVHYSNPMSYQEVGNQ